MQKPAPKAKAAPAKKAEAAKPDAKRARANSAGDSHVRNLVPFYV